MTSVARKLAEAPVGWRVPQDLSFVTVTSWSDAAPCEDWGLGHLPAVTGQVQPGPPPHGLPIAIKLAPRRWAIIAGRGSTGMTGFRGPCMAIDQSDGHIILETGLEGAQWQAMLRRLISPLQAARFGQGPAARQLCIGDIQTLVVDDGVATLRLVVRRSHLASFVGWLETAES